MTNYKSKLLYPLRIVRHVYRLPKYISFFEDQNRQRLNDTKQTRETLDKINIELRNIRAETDKNTNDLSLLPSIDARLVNLQDRFSKIKDPELPSTQSATVANNTVADNHDFDYFYKLFEDRFRGPEDIIKERVSEHIHLFNDLPSALKKLPVVDIGCGRGEFLSVLKDNKLNGIGVDMNKSMVDRAKKLGLKVEQNDAFTYLTGKKTSSLAAITGFHIVEHIPFEVLMKIFEESYRTIAPGGFALFETPNPEALTVGANSFYLDPSHQRPIPPKLLAFMVESVGFKPEIIPLHRVKPEMSIEDKTVNEIYESLYGAGDYAVIGRKIA